MNQKVNLNGPPATKHKGATLMERMMVCGICAVVLWSGICYGQTSGSGTNTNWGESVKGVQLSITLSNNVILRGSTTYITATIRNSSANVITIVETGPLAGFDVLLTSSAGKLYKLKNHIRVKGRKETMLKLQPGGSYDWAIAATISKDIEAGEYMLQAIRRYWLNDGPVDDLKSNSLKVQVK